MSLSVFPKSESSSLISALFRFMNLLKLLVPYVSVCLYTHIGSSYCVQCTIYLIYYVLYVSFHLIACTLHTSGIFQFPNNSFPFPWPVILR